MKITFNEPKCTGDFVGYSFQKLSRELRGYMGANAREFKDSEYRAELIKRPSKLILCMGYSGIGKTQFLTKLFEEMGYHIFKPSDDALLETKTLKKEINMFLGQNNLIHFMIKKPKLLLIDDIEIVLNKNKKGVDKGDDKNNPFEKFLLNVKNPKYIPIICIVNREYEVRASELKKYSRCKIFYINKPTVNEISTYIISEIRKQKVCKITSTLIENIEKLIIDKQCCIKSIYLNIDELFTKKSIKSKNKPIKEKGIIYSQQSLFDVIDKLFREKHKTEEIDYLVNFEYITIGLLLHENLIKVLCDICGKNIALANSVYKELLREFIHCEKYSPFIAQNCNWSLYEYTYITKITQVSQIICKLRKLCGKTIFNLKYDYTKYYSNCSKRLSYKNYQKEFVDFYHINYRQYAFDYLGHIMQMEENEICNVVGENRDVVLHLKTNAEIFNLSSIKKFLEKLEKQMAIKQKKK